MGGTPTLPMVENLMAIIKSGDWKNEAVKSFWQSLPNDTQKVTKGEGLIGGLNYYGLALLNLDPHCVSYYGYENCLNSFKSERNENVRDYVIVRSSAFNFKDLATEYFSSTPGVMLAQIPDKLSIVVYIEKGSMYSLFGKWAGRSYSGSIDEMIEKYKEHSSNPQGILLALLNREERLKKQMTTKRWFRPSRPRKVSDTRLMIGLEAIDGKFLLATTGWSHRYEGTLDNIEKVNY